MGNCAVCDGTASKKDEFVTNGSVLGLGSQISNRFKGSTKDDQQLAGEEEQKMLSPGLFEQAPGNPNRQQSLRYSPRDQPQTEEVPNQNYRKDFPFFTLKDVIGCISNNYVNDFESETLIYSGKLSKVSKATYKPTKTPRVLKNIRKRNALNLPAERLRREPEILSQLDHPHIIRGFGYYEGPEQIVMISDYCDGKSLKELLKTRTFTEDEAAYIMKQIFSAISYLHIQEIAHRGIQPSNILFEAENNIFSLKICGFTNSAKVKPNEAINEEVQADQENYSAPEVFKKRSSLKSDIWSAGTILYELLSGTVAFEGPTREATIEMIYKENFKMEGGKWDTVSVQAKDLVRKLIKFEPQKRPAAIEAMSHIWLKDRKDFYPKESNAMTKILKDSLTHMNQYKRVRRGLVQASWVLMSLLFSKTYEKSFHLGVFTLIDEVNDGLLTAEELVNVYSQYWKGPEAQDFVNKLFREIDVSKRGKITYSEFLISAKDPSEVLTDAHLEGLFNVIDADKDGVISKDDLQKTFDKTMRFKNEDVFGDMRDSALGLLGYRQSEKLDLQKFKRLLTTSIEYVLSMNNLE